MSDIITKMVPIATLVCEGWHHIRPWIVAWVS